MSEKPRPSRLPSDAWLYAVFGALVCVFFYDSLILGRVLMARDTVIDFVPRLEFAKTAYRDFTVPLWNPQTGCGHPFFADPYMGAAYPLNALFYLFPAAWAYRLTLVLHFALAGGGIIAIARHWGLRPSAALLAAIAFVFGTHTVAMAEFFNALFPLSWGPLIVYLGILVYDRCLHAAESGALRGEPARFLLRQWPLITALAASLALCYLAGNPQYLAFALLLLGGYGVGRLVYDRKPLPFSAAAAVGMVAGFLALLLSAPHLLPFLELLDHSFRSAAIDPGYDQGSVRPAFLLTFFLPFLFGRPGGPDAYWADTILEYQLGAFYVGILPLIAALFAFRLFRADKIDRVRWFRFLAVLLLACAGGAILMAAGKHLPFYALALEGVPGLDKLRWPSKFMLLATWAIPLLGALGFHLLLARKEQRASAFGIEWAVLALFLALPALVLLGGGLPEMFGRLAGPGVEALPSRLFLFKRDLVFALLCIGAGVAVCTLLLKAKNPSHIRALEVAFVTIAFLNVAAIGRRVHPVTDENIFAYEPQTVSTFRNMAVGDPHWRIYSAYAFDHFALYGVSDPALFKLAKKASVGETWLPTGIPRVCNSALSISRYYDFYESIGAAPPEVAGKLMDLLNVRFVISGPPWRQLAAEGLDAPLTVYPRENPLPRAFLAGNWRPVADFATGLRELASPGFDIHSGILLESGPAGAALPLPSSPETPVEGGVSGIRYAWNRVEMQVSASRPCLVVLNDTWYPGWQAVVNGAPAPIFRANLLFRAVEVPAGESSVVFEYKPPSWRNGLLLAALAVTVLGTGFAMRRRLKRDRAG